RALRGASHTPTNSPASTAAASAPVKGVPADGKGPANAALEAAPRKRTLFSFRADNLELKTGLALFARANNLNIVPDQDVTGQLTVDIHELALDQMMQALLEAHDFSWTETNGWIRVRAREERIFQLGYLRLVRNGVGRSA